MDSVGNNYNILVFLKRRKSYILIPFVVTMVVMTTITLMLPSIYISTATILIEGQEMPENMIHSTVTGFVEERLRKLKQRILSRENLSAIIEEMGLYPDLKRNYSQQELVDKMRKDIVIEPIQTDVVDMRTGMKAAATVAFTLSYESKTPETAALVSETLLNLFLQENISTRESRAWQTYNFLKQRQDELQAEIRQAEKDIAVFKEQHLRSLPELMDLNLRTIESLQNDMEIKHVQLQAAQDRLIFLQGQLATVAPSTPFMAQGMPRAVTVEDQLKSLRSQYVSLTAAHSDKHPDVVRVGKEIAALERVASAKGHLADLYKQLKDRETSRSVALEKYAPQHPTVLALDDEIATIHRQIEQASLKGEPAPQTDTTPDNPAYINVMTQIESTRLEIRNLTSLLGELQNKYNEYQRIIEQTPKVEQEYQALQRHSESIQKELKENYARLQTAQESIGMEEQQMGERYTVAEPPLVPEKPSKPNRPVLLVLCLLFSTGLGGAIGAVAEHLDHSIHNTAELMEVTGRPALGLVPYLESPKERRIRKSQRRIGLIVFLALALVLLVAAHVIYMPLDEMWKRSLKFLDFIF